MDNDKLSDLISRYSGYRYMLWSVPIGLWFMDALFTLVPFHTLNFIFLMYLLAILGCVGLTLSIVVNRMLMNFTTRRTDNDEDERIELLSRQKEQMNRQTVAIFGGIAALPFVFTFIPYMEFLMDHPNKGVTRQMVQLLVGSGFFNNILILFIPVAFTFLIYSLITSDEETNQREIEDWMRKYEYHNRHIKDALNGGKAAKFEPNIVLGQSLETGDDVVQTVTTRRQNTVIYGPIGSGKTSTFFIPQIRQDIDSYLEYIRDYKKASKDPTWMKPHGLASRYLNGFNVIDPTNDLCKEVYHLCMEMGVPKDKVIWLDPDNEKTPSMNLLRGPVEKAAENVSNIINGLKGGNNDFFQQSERTHLKNMVYLLKLTAVMDGSIASFADLMDMYNDIELVWDKVQILDKYCIALKNKMEQAERSLQANKHDTDKRSHYLELKDKYAVAWQTDQWFHRNVQVQKVGKNVITYDSGPHQGHVKHYDVQDEFVHGLTNLLDDISKNIAIRRVLFRDSGDFNLDDFLKNGGILLCSTAKATVGDQLAEILGQVYTLSFQAATYRRQPNCEPMHPLYADEFPDYLSEGFKDYAAQARKYNVPIVIAAQSPAQLAYKYGNNYFDTLMSVMLTRCTFGDLGRADAELLAPLFGEKTQNTITANEQKIRVISGQDNNREMIGTRKETVPNITASQIMGLERYTIAVRTPGPHSSNMFNRIRVHRITPDVIANDPLRFSLEDKPADRQSYDYMEQHQVHENPDFDEIDKQIMNDPSLLINSMDNDNTETENQQQAQDDNSDDTELFSDDEIDTKYTNVGNNTVKSKLHFDKSPVVNFASTHLTHEEALRVAENAVKGKSKMSFDAADNNIDVKSKELNKVSDNHKIKKDADTHSEAPLSDKQLNREPMQGDKPYLEKKNGDDKMMHLEGVHKSLVVDAKNRRQMTKDHQVQEQNKMQATKREALSHLMSQIKVIENNPVNGSNEKLHELLALRNTVIEQLSVLFPHSINEVMDQTINNAIARQKHKLRSHKSVVKKSDNYYLNRQKAIDTGHRKDFQDDFDAVMFEMNDNDDK